MGKDELISQMNEFVWRLFFVSHTWNIHNIEINAGEATAGFGVANLHVSEAALTFFGFYNLTLVGEIMTSRPPEKILLFQEMMQDMKGSCEPECWENAFIPENLDTETTSRPQGPLRVFIILCTILQYFAVSRCW